MRRGTIVFAIVLVFSKPSHHLRLPQHASSIQWLTLGCGFKYMLVKYSNPRHLPRGWD